MKNMFLVALAALSLTAAIVPAANAASTFGTYDSATRSQQEAPYGK